MITDDKENTSLPRGKDIEEQGLQNYIMSNASEESYNIRRKYSLHMAAVAKLFHAQHLELYNV
jgi:hypothetical protein